MNINFIVENIDKNKIFDLSEIVQDITFESYMKDNPGILKFSYYDVDNIGYVTEGSSVSFKIDEEKVFWGYVFKISKETDKKVSVTCYDQLRYFKYKDTYIFSESTATNIFKKICTDFNINNKVVNSSSYLLEARIYDDKTLAEMIQYAFDKTLIDTGEWYFMRDNYGTLEMLNVSNQVTNLVIGDSSLLTSYTYESSIDGDTYNQVKLVKENKDTKKRELYIVKDSSTIKKWGLLQYYEKVDENMNDAQIKDRANMLLKHYNKPQKTLKIEALGHLKVKAGCGVILMIKDLENDTVYKKNVIVTKAEHNFKNNEHTMKLEVQIV